MVGVANRGGVISNAWLTVLERALELGMDLAAGLHNRLADQAILAGAAEAHGRALHDVRHPTREFAVANGKRRTGKRLLTVGTDCSVGKMYTSLAIERELKAAARRPISGRPARLASSSSATAYRWTPWSPTSSPARPSG